MVPNCRHGLSVCIKSGGWNTTDESFLVEKGSNKKFAPARWQMPAYAARRFTMLGMVYL
jgi:hypothetical protein